MTVTVRDYQEIDPISIVPGAEVTGDNFFGRSKELKAMREALDNGLSISIPGPRRWGKSSFIKEFGERNCNDYHFLYMHLHECQSVSRFYQYFVDILDLKHPRAFLLKSKQGMKAITNTITKIISAIGWEGYRVETGQLKEGDAATLFQDMAKVMRLFPGHKIVLVLDEISDFLIDIKNSSGEAGATSFLKWLRAVRQTHDIQMIFTGSVNIIWALKLLKCEDLVGDMKTFPLQPLTPEESGLFFRSLLKSKGICVVEEAYNFCEEKVRDGIHYFIQVLADTISEKSNSGDVIARLEDMEGLYDIFLQEERPAFSDYHTRLSDYLGGNEERAAYMVLANTAYAPKDFDGLFVLTGDLLGDDRERLYKLLRRLCDEGYLRETKGSFAFISQLLADYWQNHFYYQQ